MEILKHPGRRIPYWAYMLCVLVLIVVSLNLITHIHSATKGIESKIQTWFYIALYTLALIVSATSLFILYKKPYDPAAKIFFIFLQLFAIAGNFKYLFSNEPHALFVNIAYIISFNLYGVLLFHFNLIFPKSESIYKRYKKLLKVVYLIGLLFGITVTILLILRNVGGSENDLEAFNQFSRWSLAWMGLTLSAALGVAIHQFISTKVTQERRQLRLVLIGSAFGLVTPILFSMFPGYFLKMESTRHLLTFEFANGTGTFIMTSFLVIAIFRYRIWNIEHYIRKVILYSGATVIIYLSYLSVVYLVDMLTNDSDNIIHFFALAASIMIFILLRDIIQKLIDRLFHRELYNTVDVVKMFEKKFAGIYQTEALKSGIVQSLYDILHFKSFALLEKISDTAYNAIQLYGIDNFILDKEFEVNFETDELLKKTNIFSVEELREKPEIIEFCHGEIIVPLVTGDQFFGFMIIGPRLKGMSYSLQDIQVLALLANRAISLFKTASLYQKDLDRQLMLERERTRIARDVHDDVGANLTRISILCDLAKNNASDPVKITPWLHQISETSHNVILDMTQIIWALNPKNDIFEGLVAYIRRFALEYLETTPVKCTFNFPEKLPELALGGEVRRNIYLCIREALHNVVKHAEASNVLILLQVNVHGFTIMIKDDGRGFDFCKRTSGGNGMTNMMKRMKDIGGKFHIRANEKEGTEISFIVPMKSAHDN